MSGLELTITITRALAELKILDKRINNVINNTTFISTKVVGQAYKDHESETRSGWQSFNDLVDRYNRLRRAVIASNATTRVKINGNEMSVAEAIEMKKSISFKKNLLERLRRQRQDVKVAVDNHTNLVRVKLDQLLNTSFENERKSGNEDNIKTISESYLKNNRIDVIDPIKLDTKIPELEEYVDGFLSEVDLVLSESNARTLIQI